MKSSRVYDMIIIGGGPGGYTAALYAARAGLDTLVLEKLSAGGQMALSLQIDNYPGFPEGIDGFSLAEKMQEQAHRFGAETQYAHVSALDLKSSPKKAVTDLGTFYGKTLVVATGANPKELGLVGEKELVGKGLAYCAACDGMFFKGKTVAVIGGGNSAAADALLLSRVAEKVMLIYRRDKLSATKIYHAPLANAENIVLMGNTVAGEFIRGERLSGLRLKNTASGEESTVECDGVFISVGRKPATELLAGQLELNGEGYIPAGEDTRTEIPGVFAVGDVRAKPLRQIVTAVADGAAAVQAAEEYLAEVN